MQPRLASGIERKEGVLDAHLGAIKVPTLSLSGAWTNAPLKSGESCRPGIAGPKLVVLDHCVMGRRSNVRRLVTVLENFHAK